MANMITNKSVFAPGKEDTAVNSTPVPATGSPMPVVLPAPGHRHVRLQTPQALKQLDSWVNWKALPDPDGQKPRKVPIDPRTGKTASCTRPETWSDFRTARDACKRNGCAGLGFELHKESGLVAIDIDHCYAPVTGTFTADARAILARQDTYAEFSPSGDGIHIWYKGVKPGPASRNNRTGVEMYDSARYLTVTGRRVPGTSPEIAEAAPGTLEWIYENFIVGPKETVRSADGNRAADNAPAEITADTEPCACTPLSDEELLSRAGRNERFARLFAGDWEAEWEAGRSQSEVDLGFCNMLAFWTGRNAEQMDRLFRRSGLMRRKWDEVHYASGETYGEHQLQLAICSCKDVYSASFCSEEDLAGAFRLAAEQEAPESKGPVLEIVEPERTKQVAMRGTTESNTTEPETGEALPETADSLEPVEYPEPAPEPEQPRISSFGNRVYASGGRLIYITDKKHVELTNYLVHPVALVEGEDQTVYVADYITTDGNCTRISMTAEEFSNCGKYHSKLNATGIDRQFYGDSKSMEAMKAYLSRMPWPKKRGVSAEGIHFTPQGAVYVSADGAFGADGVPVEDIQLLNPCEDGLTGAILQAEPLKSEQLEELGPCLLGYNELPITASILGWIAGCFLKQHLLSGRRLKYPHLGLHGEAGSGKSSTLENIILPVFSTERVYACSNISRFSLLRLSASSNLIPLILDEYKPWRMVVSQNHEILNFARDAYDGHNGVRGRANQTTVSYKLQAPLILAGEAGPDETAVRERFLEVPFSKHQLREPEELPEGMPGRMASYLYLRRQPDVMSAFGKALLLTALAVPAEEALRWYDEGLSRFDPTLPPRVVNNLACCYAGLRLVEALCVRMGLSWDAVFPVSTEECRAQMERVVIDDLLGGSTHNTTVVEGILEIMSRSQLIHNKHYWLDSEGENLSLHLTACYDVLLKYAHDHHLQDEIMELNEFRKQLKVSGYIRDVNKDMDAVRQKTYYDPDNGNQPATRSIRVCILDFKKLKENCDVSGFEEKPRNFI